jgi:acetylornithine deacetylase/succinyl-diaminopimelate desuccinylase-like protein
MTPTAELSARIQSAVKVDRLLDTAMRLIEVPSPTRSGKAVADRLEEILREDGFPVERPEADWSEAPAVASRYDTGKSGRILQFNGHLDTVHLPFVPPRVEDGLLYGSGSSDMKGGIAAAVEAMRALRDADALSGGSTLLTAHDLHETPWGDGSQVDGLIDAGYLGDAVLLPEYLCTPLPIIGRGLSVLNIEVKRAGEPVHEVLGGIEQPSVIGAGAEIVKRFEALDVELSQKTHPMAGRESMFLGQVSAGEIFNQSPTELHLAGTRRWLPGTSPADVERQYHDILAEVAAERGVDITGRFQMARDAMEINPGDPFVAAFQAAHMAATGSELPIGAKPFVDDGNTFVSHGRIPAITHGPDAKGAHTLHEEVPIDELVRVANVYALTAVAFCGE